MYKVTICIPTYKRALMLEDLLLSIKESDVDQSFISSVNVIVVDNDGERSAEHVLESIENKGTAVDFSYFSYPAKGLANVRNELLRRAYQLAPDFIIFVDDDELVTSTWLMELVKTIVNKDGDAVRGPSFPVFDPSIPSKITYWFKRETYPDGAEIDTVCTNNLILRRTSLEKFGIWFDPRFNFSGSEDTYFGTQILQKGARMYWAANAKVFETIPISRATIDWLLKRKYRSAGTFLYTLKLEREHFLVIKKILISIGNLVVGGVSLLALLSNNKKKYWGLFRIAEGLGGFSGLINKTYHEYNK